MRLRAILAAAFVLALTSSAQAVSLVVMAVNTTAVPGDKVYTIGVAVTPADLTAPGVGANPGIFVQNVTFTGGAGGPVQATGSNNKQDIQTVWGTVDANNAGTGTPSFPTAGGGTIQLYKDSYWYSGSGGSLQGIFDSTGLPGTVTTVPASDGSGVYAQGPGAFVGTTGFLFNPEGASPNPAGGATTGSTMSYSGLYGPTGSTDLTAAPLSALFGSNPAFPGELVVPLAQIVASGNITIPSDYAGGAGTFISIGQAPYNVVGGAVGTDPGAVLNFTTNTITGGPITPEPSTLMLAGMGMVGLVVAYRRRRK